MTVSLRPELQKLVEEKVKAGLFPSALNLLESNPGIGHRRRDVRNPRYRFWRANRFIIAYYRDTNPLQIIRVVGGHRDFRALFKQS